MAFRGSKTLTFLCAAIFGAGAFGLKVSSSSAAQGDKESDITAIMKKAFKGAGRPRPGGPGGAAPGGPGGPGGPKGKPSLVTKAIEGSATDDEMKSLLGYCQDLSKAKAPKGDQKDWDERTAKMIKAIQALSTSKTDKTASSDLKNAANCKECHTKHKED